MANLSTLSSNTAVFSRLIFSQFEVRQINLLDG